MTDPEHIHFNSEDLYLGNERATEYQIRVDFPQDQSSLVGGIQPHQPNRTRSSGFGLPANRIEDARAEQIEQRSASAINAAMNTIKEMAYQTDLMRKGIPGGSQPRMIKVKFGINLDFEVGALIAKSGMGASLAIELEWARASDDVLRVLRAETDVQSALHTSKENLSLPNENEESDKS